MIMAAMPFTPILMVEVADTAKHHSQTKPINHVNFAKNTCFRMAELEIVRACIGLQKEKWSLKNKGS